MALPDIVVADHAPTALLSTRGRDLARVVMGTPFAVPRPESPTPNMRPWISVPEQRLASSDAVVLECINANLPAGAPRLGAVHEIFDGASSLLTGVPEIDPFGPRDPLGYLGLNGGRTGGVLPQWPDGDGPRIFAYLRSDYQHLGAALEALAASGTRCLAYLFGATADLKKKYQGPRLAFSDSLLDLGAVLPDADLCICHGSAGTVMNILRAGKPMLLLPMQLEHFLLSARIEQLGIAGVVGPEAQPLDIGGALARVLREASMANAARAFAERHREPSVDTIIERAATRIEALARTRGKPG